jgi:Trypsin-co-occurring domain 2
MANAIVNLSDAIDGLRQEFTDAIAKAGNSPMLFEVGSVDLTVEAAVSTDANGKIGWHIFGVGASHERSNTQTLTLKLTPMWRKPDGSYDRNFAISSQDRRAQTFGDEPIPPPAR